MDKRTVVQSYNGIPISNKKEQTTDTWNKEWPQNIMVSKGCQTQNNTDCMIPFIWGSRTGKINL